MGPPISNILSEKTSQPGISVTCSDVISVCRNDLKLRYQPQKKNFMNHPHCLIAAHACEEATSHTLKWKKSK